MYCSWKRPPEKMDTIENFLATLPQKLGEFAVKNGFDSKTIIVNESTSAEEDAIEFKLKEKDSELWLNGEITVEDEGVFFAAFIEGINSRNTLLVGEISELWESYTLAI